jgi:hypothetical protein
VVSGTGVSGVLVSGIEGASVPEIDGVLSFTNFFNRPSHPVNKIEAQSAESNNHATTVYFFIFYSPVHDDAIWLKSVSAIGHMFMVFTMATKRNAI